MNHYQRVRCLFEECRQETWWAYVKTEAKTTKICWSAFVFLGLCKASSFDRVQISVVIFSKSADVSKRYVVGEAKSAPVFMAHCESSS